VSAIGLDIVFPFGKMSTKPDQVHKVNGRIYAGIAINKDAEPNSLFVYLADFDQREALLSEDPDTYYLKPHYEQDPVVLVRLACVTRDALKDLLCGAHRVVSSKPPQRRQATKRR
jgi:hypothetical protein